MLAFFANIFGYVLQFLYNFIGNYGWAIILFSILVKIIMIPMSLKQQKSMKKNQKIQEEVKQIQFKYKNDPEKQNKEIMALYKREGTSPFSGCISSIIQILLLFSVFLLVRQPLTYMEKMDTDIINNMKTILAENIEGFNINDPYAEIKVIQYARDIDNKVSTSKDGQFDMKEYSNQANLNMNFLGIDLSQIPSQNWQDIKVLIIPILYVISSFISIRISTNMTNMTKKKEEKKLITDGDGEEEDKEKERYNPMPDASKTMMWMMPIMSISIAAIAPLGLALYWLMNNILMIVERLIYNNILNKEEEAEKNAE